MRSSRLLSLAATAFLLTAGFATASESPQPIFVDGSQYTVVLDQTTQLWQVLPLDGHDLRVSTDPAQCPASRPIAEGVWLITRDALGQPELVAPSVTALAPGQSDRVKLRACGEIGDDAPTLWVPSALIDWLVNSAGAVYVSG